VKPQRRSSAALHARAREIFLEARWRSGSLRQRYLRDACRGDEALQAEVESLLAFDRDEATPIDCPALGPDFVVPEAPESCLELLPEGARDGEAQLPDHIGRYAVIAEIGRGGMGVVYLAEQGLTRRRVAVKVLRSRSHSPHRLGQFEREAQILGLLKHPGIAQIYEAGTADLGQGPQMFFAIELVDGPPITEFARQRSLSVAARVELLAQVCDAVHHAHGRAVLHRDLKPDNVLVDEGGAPKVLDFGVARFDENASGGASADFERGRLVGTPAYMSPEQLAGSAAELDSRSDVYALGVLGHELLTGELPPAPGRVCSAPALDDELAAVARKALAADPRERYVSAAALAADLRRYLAHEPLAAHGSSAGYLLRKFAQRRRALALSLAALFLLLVAGVVVSSTLAVQAHREANRKERLIEFLRELLMSPNPMHSGSDVSMLEVLAESEDMIRRRLAGEPEVEAEVRLTLGVLYRQLGDTEHAQPHLRNALELFRRTQGEAGSQTVLAKLELANLLVLYLEGADEAELLLRDTLALERGATPESRELRVRALSLSASIHRGRGEFDQAVAAYEHAEALTPGSTEPDEQALALRSFRARALAEGGRFPEAEQLARSTLERETRLLGAEHRQTLISQVTLGSILLQRSLGDGEPARLDEAEALLRRALAGRVTRLGPEHPGTQSARQLLAEVLEQCGRVEEALGLQREVYAAYERTLGLERPDAVQAFERLESLLDSTGRVEEARALRGEHEARLGRAFGAR
jgi:serine/threonine protein kinase